MMSDNGPLTCDAIIKTEVVFKDEPEGVAIEASTTGVSADQNREQYEDCTVTNGASNPDDALEPRYARQNVVPTTLAHTRHCVSSPLTEEEHQHLEGEDSSDFDSPPSPLSPVPPTSFSTMPSTSAVPSTTLESTVFSVPSTSSTSSPPAPLSYFDSVPVASSVSTDTLDNNETASVTRKRPRRNCPVETLNVVQEMLLNPPPYHVRHLHSLAAFMAARFQSMDVRKRKRVENRLIQLILDEDP